MPKTGPSSEEYTAQAEEAEQRKANKIQRHRTKKMRPASKPVSNRNTKPIQGKVQPL